VMAGIPALVAVSAPSSLAVELAQASGLTLAAFARAPRMTVYAGAERVVLEESTPKDSVREGSVAEGSVTT
jgi:FdhD protein